MDAGRKFLEQTPIPPAGKKMIAHSNAERPLGI
jgi:hypothetical protein